MVRIRWTLIKLIFELGSVRKLSVQNLFLMFRTGTRLCVQSKKLDGNQTASKKSALAVMKQHYLGK